MCPYGWLVLQWFHFVAKTYPECSVWCCLEEDSRTPRYTNHCLGNWSFCLWQSSQVQTCPNPRKSFSLVFGKNYASQIKSQTLTLSWTSLCIFPTDKCLMIMTDGTNVLHTFLQLLSPALLCSIFHVKLNPSDLENLQNPVKTKLETFVCKYEKPIWMIVVTITARCKCWKLM